MVAATQAQSITVSVGGVGLTQCLVSLEVGWDSYEQGSGLLLKKGTLTVCNVLGGPTLNPMNQDGFLPGKIVTIGGHPMVNIMRVLAPPEVSSINSGIPQLEGNLVVSIPIGCELAYRKTKEPDRDATGVTLGTEKNLGSVIVDLLTAAGISGSNIGAISSDYSIDWPYSKNGGGFVDLAGEFAYVASGGGVSFLYCDSDNIINLKTLPRTATVSGGITVTLGTNDRDYRWQLDSTLAPGEVETSGIQRFAVDMTLDYPFTDVVEEEQALYTNTNNEDGTQTTTTTIVTVRTEKTYYYREGFVPRRIGRIIENFTPALSDGVARIGYDLELTRYKAYQGTETVTYQDDIETGREYQLSLFDWYDRLACEVSYVGVQAVTLYPDGWEEAASTPTTQNKINEVANRVVPSEIVVTKFFFTDDLITKRVSTSYANLFLIDRSADFSDDNSTVAPDFYWAFFEHYNIGGYNLGVKQIKSETWKLKSKRWTYDTEVQVPLIINNPGFVGNPDNRAGNRTVKLSISPKASIPSSTSILARDTQPPGITYWEGRYKLEEIQLTGRAYFGTGENTKRYKIQSSFWMDAAQPDTFAQIEGQIINGRQYQHLVEADASSTSSDEPLIGASVAGNTFLADSLTWFHTPTETYVAFAGILTGGSGDPALGGGGFPTGLFNTSGGDGSLVDENGDVVLDANGNVVYSGTITVSGYAIGSTVRGTAYDI